MNTKQINPVFINKCTLAIGQSLCMKLYKKDKLTYKYN